MSRRIDRVAVLAEFVDPGALLRGARRLRDEGYELVDAYTPHPVDGMEEVLALPRTRLPWVALASGAVGGGLAYGIQWWTTAVDLPLNVGARPVNAVPAFVPITFETVVLFASVALVLAFLWRSGLPRPWQPVFEVEGFERASVDRFWLAVDRRDARFEPDATRTLLTALDRPPLRVLLVDDEGRVLDETRPGPGEPPTDPEGAEP